MQEEIIETLITRVTEEVSVVVKDSLAGLVEAEVAKALNRAINEGEFYKSINDEMRTGLGSIYKEISSVKNDDKGMIPLDSLNDNHQELFSETTDQLDQVITATEEATFKIMDIVEGLLTRQDDIKDKLDALCQACKNNGTCDKVTAHVDQSTNMLLEMMTVLSFQDLTGQRIKHTISVLKKIEKIVTDLYVSTGLMMKERQDNPEKDLEQIKKDSDEAMGQANVDDMLSQMGLE